MLCITDSTTDPRWNLAAEEYLVDNFDGPLFRLWRNSPSVIIGRNQNAASEIDRRFIEENGIALVRRLSGGGAVFHDLGNVNFSFIEKAKAGESAGEMFRRFTSPIISALHKMGIDAELDGRNDIMAGDAKISGNAMCLRSGRVLQHGTLLFSADLTRLSGALLPRPEKYAGRAVKSVRSRVTNIADLLPSPMGVEQFIERLQTEIAANAEQYVFSQTDRSAITELADRKYRSDKWNWGGCGKMQDQENGRITRIRKFPAGLLEVSYRISEGLIRDVRIHGDYFFIRQTEEFCTLLEGCPHDKKAVTDLLGTVTVSDWFSGIAAEELAELLI